MDRSGHTGVSCKLEFAVQITCGKCIDAVKSSLQNVQGVQNVTVNLESESVLVDTILPALEVQNLIESSGRKAVLKGMGSVKSQNLGAAVAMMSGEGSLQGVVRFLQVSQDTCVIDGTVDGLSPGLHGLHIHEFGDNSAGCESCGGHYNPFANNHGAPGEADSVWDVIGRSLLVDEGEDDLGRGNHPPSKMTGNSGKGVACGIIARSAGLFENTKKMCSCDGVTIWEERDHPVAGLGRKKQDTHAHL
ncbi:copper chaperone for superoxide dismutase isoform X2 [Lithobates pipiens]